MKCFIRGFEDKKLKAISLVCENCDILYFEDYDIWELLLDDFYKLNSSFQNNRSDNFFDTFLIRIRRSSIPREDESNDNPHESFKWKLHMHNICAVNLFFEDGDTFYAYLPYQTTKPKKLEDKKYGYGYNFLEEYIYDDDYLNIKVSRKNTRSKKDFDQKKLIKIIKDYFKATYPKVGRVILFGDYASRKYNEDSVVSLYVDENYCFYSMKNDLAELLDKDVFVLSTKEISINDSIFKDTITII